MPAPPEILAAFAAERGLALDASQRVLLDRYAADVLEHGKKVNITADLDLKSIYLRHLADGLVAAKALSDIHGDKPFLACEIGAGAGFIGITVKIALPHARVALVESVERKFRFLNAAAMRLGLKDLRVYRKTAGKDPIPDLEGRCDAALARALAPLPECLKLTLPFLNSTGRALLFQSQEPKASSVEKSIPYCLPDEAADRYLAMIRG